MRDLSDHGTAQDAIDYAIDHAGMEADCFLRAWREGDLAGEWEEFYEWLDKREGAQSPAVALAQIGRMKLFPDDKINRATLQAAIKIAQRAAE